MSMIPNIAKNLHGYNGYNGTDLVKQKFEQKNTSFPEFMMKVVDVTVSTQMSHVVDEPDTKKFLQLSSITLKISILSLQLLLH